MNIILNIQGGLGKNIMATALVKGIKKKYKKSKVIVITAYKDVFLHNPNVDVTLKHEEQLGVYKNYIKGQENRIFAIDPYATDDFQNDRKHVLKIWFELCGLKYKGEQPEFFLTDAEKEFYSGVYKTQKPILTIQTHGGAPSQGMKYNWARDLPDSVILKLIEDFKDEYDVVHVKRQDQPVYDNTLQALDGFRSIAYLLSASEKIVCIDSFVQHLAKAIDKKAVVLWSTTKPEMFGYSTHTNIKANEFTKEPNIDHSHYKEFELVESIEKCPYNSLDEIFNYEYIYKFLKK